MPVSGDRLDIGIQFPILRTRYTQALLRHAVESAASRGIRLWLFAGNAYSAPYPQERAGNSIYEYINTDNLHGLMALAGPLFYYAGVGTLPFDRLPYRRIPTVSLSCPIPGVPTITTDNRSGAYRLVEHLIGHGYTKIAFVQGSPRAQDAVDRQSGWEDCMRAHGLEPDTVIPGDFTRAAGMEAIRVLKADGAIPGGIQAVFLANDDMAIGAVQECQRLGIRIPGDLAVVGFDNISESDSDHYNLTTVDHNYGALIDTAFDVLRDSIRGSRVEPETRVPSYAVVRSTCGCSGVINSGDPRFPSGDPDTRFAMLESQFSGKFYHKPVDKRWVDDFSADFVSAVQSSPDTGIQFWMALLRKFEATLLKRYQSDEERTLLVTGMLQSLATTPFRSAIITKSTRSTNQEDQFAHLSDMIQNLNSATSMPHLFELVANELAKLDIGHCGIYRYAEPFAYRSPGDPPGAADMETLPEAYPVLRFENGLVYGVDDEPLPTGVLTSAEARDNGGNRLVMPLNHGDQQQGYIVFDLDIDRYFVYDTLRVHVSSALNAVGMLERLQVLSRQDDLTGLLNRRGFMETARHNYLLSLRNGLGGAVFYIDLDDMKRINDRYGHAAGDEFLRVAARILKCAFRETDVVGRISGDEFVVLAVNADNDAVNAIKARISEAMSRENENSGHDWKLDMSIGVRCYGPSDPNGFDRLLEQADQSLYKAKGRKSMTT